MTNFFASLYIKNDSKEVYSLKKNLLLRQHILTFKVDSLRRGNNENGNAACLESVSFFFNALVRNHKTNMNQYIVVMSRH